MLQKNIVENDSMCDMQRYVYIVKLQNFLNAPRNAIAFVRLTVSPSVCFHSIFRID